jgi:hypothetical protein
MMSERIRFGTHNEKQVLFVDLTGCSPRQVEDIVRLIPDYVTNKPQGSVLVLVEFTGATFDHDTVRAMQQAAVFNKAYIKKSAWVGAENLSHSSREEIRRFSGRDFPMFKNREEALKWLTG